MSGVVCLDERMRAVIFSFAEGNGSAESRICKGGTNL